MKRWSSDSKANRRNIALLAAAAAGLVAARAEASEITSTWSGNSGDWTDGTQWSTNPNYPNNGTPSGVSYDALINAPGAGAYIVSLSSSITTDSVTLSTPNATLSQTGGTLTAGALNISAGTYSLSGGAANFTSYNNTGGTFSVSDGSSFQFFPGGANFNNAGGTIEAGVNSSIFFSLSGTVTTAQLGSFVGGGGEFSLVGQLGPLYDFIDNTASTLAFSGSTSSVLIEEAAIDGGVVSLPSTNLLHDVGLKDVTLASDISGTEDLNIQGVNFAGHTINVFGQPHSASASALVVFPDDLTNSSVTLSNANVNLGGGPNSSGGGYVIGKTSAVCPFTIDPTTVISGFGGVGCTAGGGNDPSVTNQGIIAASVSGQSLQVGKNNSNPEPLITNTGTLEAINGGILDVNPLISLSGFTFAWINNGILSIDAASAIHVSQPTYFATGSALNMILGSSGSSGLLSITGGLACQDGAVLNLALEPGAVFSGPYEIATYTSYLAGAFSQVTPGFVVDYSHSGEILVTAIPEPATGALWAGTAGLLLARRRRARRECDGFNRPLR